jgi:hypothetical protein
LHRNPCPFAYILWFFRRCKMEKSLNCTRRSDVLFLSQPNIVWSWETSVSSPLQRQIVNKALLSWTKRMSIMFDICQTSCLCIMQKLRAPIYPDLHCFKSCNLAWAVFIYWVQTSIYPKLSQKVCHTFVNHIFRLFSSSG